MTLKDALAAEGPRDPRILVIDIETSPALVWTYDLKVDYISPSNIVEPSRVLCFAAKWHGEDRIVFHSEQDGRKPMLEEAWRLLDEADAVCSYNGVKFDLPHLQREFVLNGYGPPSPWHDVDLLKEVRKHFRFMSNRLGYVTEQLGLDRKGDPGGMATWLGCLQGDPDAWKTMARYNRQDVAITADLFDYLRPWLKLPHAGLFTGNEAACHACGSTRLTPAGVSRTKTAAYLRFSCACGAWNRVLSNGKTRPA